MLVLSRKINEVITIGNDIKILVVDIRSDKVRVGITAPRTVAVHREEVYDSINRELAQIAATEANGRDSRP